MLCFGHRRPSSGTFPNGLRTNKIFCIMFLLNAIFWCAAICISLMCDSHLCVCVFVCACAHMREWEYVSVCVRACMCAYWACSVLNDHLLIECEEMLVKCCFMLHYTTVKNRPVMYTNATGCWSTTLLGRLKINIFLLFLWHLSVLSTMIYNLYFKYFSLYWIFNKRTVLDNMQ
jgi:hypothetical protein